MKEASIVDSMYGFPVATADNWLQVAKDLGIVDWPHRRSVMPLSQYKRQRRSAEEKAQDRFAPETEVVSVGTPEGEPFAGFRVVTRPWASAFVLLGGRWVVVVFEYKHGADSVILALPSGVPNRQELQSENPLARAAWREFEEETGISLNALSLLADEPLWVSSRQETARFLPCLGVAHDDIRIGPRRQDPFERLGVAVMELSQLRRLIRQGGAHLDISTALTVMLACETLGL